jgi:hypothetical protein
LEQATECCEVAVEKSFVLRERNFLEALYELLGAGGYIRVVYREGCKCCCTVVPPRIGKLPLRKFPWPTIDMAAQAVSAFAIKTASILFAGIYLVRMEKCMAKNSGQSKVRVAQLRRRHVEQ